MRLGFGVSFLAARYEHGKLDGIGVYTQALWDQFRYDDNQLYPLSFKSGDALMLAQDKLASQITSTKLPYPFHSGISALRGGSWGELKNYESSIDLFFAPDHHIPFLRDTPVVATVMDIIPFIHPEWASKRLRRVKNYAFKKAVQSATHIITISQHSKRDIIELFDIAEQKISVVPLGVNRKFFDRVDKDVMTETKERYGIERNFFLFVGTMQPRKNILRIIQAYRKLPNSIKKDYMLVLAGQDGWGSRELKDAIKEMVESNDGIWLSYLPQNDIYALMQSAKAIVYPSLYEGFGLPIVEGFASQVPMITSNITSMPEVAGDAALLVNPYSVDAIADAMLQLVNDKKLCDKLIESGSQRIKEYTWELSARKHLEIFEMVADKGLI